MVANDDGFDPWDPANISPLIAWLCMEGCPATGQVYWSMGNKLARYLEWAKADMAEVDGKWEIDEIDEVLGGWETGVVESRLLKVEQTRTLDTPRG